jgi:hypothetical protein
MARIKYIINERRLAYEGAVQIIVEGNENEVLGKKTLEEEQATILEPSKVEEPPVTPHRTAAERAAAGLLQPELEQK